MPYAAESIVVTAAREAKKIWPFLTGMGVVGFAVVKVTAAATPEDIKKSKFTNPNQH